MAQRVYGFTLAEVLIALVIIGIIAALTIPNLLQKYQEQATVKKVQKFYSTLSNAYSLAVKENGSANEWGITGVDTESAEKIYKLLFEPYFKIAKNCGVSKNGKCLTDKKYKTLNNNENNNIYMYNTHYYKIVLNDGAAIWWRGDSNTRYSIDIFYDVNGIKGPNQWGKDLFEFITINNKVVPSGFQSGTYSFSPFNTNCQKTTTGSGCAAWIIYKGNMDYLHCDLTWDKHSCKD